MQVRRRDLTVRALRDIFRDIRKQCSGLRHSLALLDESMPRPPSRGLGEYLAACGALRRHSLRVTMPVAPRFARSFRPSYDGLGFPCLRSTDSRFARRIHACGGLILAPLGRH